VTHPRPLPPSAPKPRRFARALLGTLLLAAVAVTGCKDSTTPIKDILDDPARFQDEKVRIQGDVTSSVGVLGTGAYEVDDGTGRIVVVSKAGGVPREGARVGVEGVVRPGFTLGTQTLTVLMEERRITP
jgi:hypothetical protein